MKVTYFQLWARGPSIVLALEHAGVDYEAAFPDNWKELKPTAPWGALPLFEAPLAGKVLTLGHELAILAYIERKCPAVGGADEREWAVSQQFVHQAEDVYKALVAKQPTLYEKDKVSKEALAEWWAGDDRTLHNRKQGLQVHLALLEAAAAATPLVSLDRTEGTPFSYTTVPVGRSACSAVSKLGYSPPQLLPP